MLDALSVYGRSFQRFERVVLRDRHGDLDLRPLQRRRRCMVCGARDAELIPATALPG